jgi:hypothetical protein
LSVESLLVAALPYPCYLPVQDATQWFPIGIRFGKEE